MGPQDTTVTLAKVVAARADRLVSITEFGMTVNKLAEILTTKVAEPTENTDT
jgi:hypothetical protein